MTDIVIPYSNQSNWKDNELRYSIRSIEKNFLDLGQIWIIGYKTKWLKNIRHIDMPDCYTQNKGANLIQKVLRVCFEKDLSETFIRQSDDQYWLKSLRAKDVKPYYIYNLSDKKRWRNKGWKDRLMRSYQILKAMKCSTWNYEGHFPQPVNKGLFADIWMRQPYGHNLLAINSLYFNQVLKIHKEMPFNHRACFFRQRIEVEKEIKGKTFLCHDDLGLSWQLQNKLKELFTDKSYFEK